METIVTCEQMQELDRHTIQDMGMPSLVLMERASLAVVREMENTVLKSDKILVVCGSGNNGGDGIAVARILHLKGYDVSVYILGNADKMTQETSIQKEIALKYQVPMVNNLQLNEYTTIVDAIFGVGLSREIRGAYRDVITQINNSSATVWAVDIPSGVSGDTGFIWGCAVKADVTVTFGYRKVGQLLYPGAAYCGRLICRDIGIYEMSPKDNGKIQAVQICDLHLLPVRRADGHKGTFGKALLIAGSPGMAGASYLSARACLMSGTGMVKIHTCEENRVILQQMFPEAMLYTQPCAEDLALDRYKENFAWCDVAAIGPGLGQNPKSEQLLEAFCRYANCPAVIDADGLNVLSRHKDWLKMLAQRNPAVILTPHIGEMSRLMGESTEKIKSDPVAAALACSRLYSVICVLKDARTIVVAPDGSVYINTTGNEGMGTAGSGDVLTGILTGILASGLAPKEAAALGVFIHGRAGDYAKEEKGSRGMTAGDILTFIDRAFSIEER